MDAGNDDEVIEPLGLPIARQVLRAAIDGAVLQNPARTAHADERRQRQAPLFGAPDQRSEEIGQSLDRILALRGIVAMAP